MPDALISVHNTSALLCSQDGGRLSSDRHAVDLIGDAMSQGVTMVIIPVSRLDPSFFQLRSRVAGEIIQKFVTHGVRLAILGDISEQLAVSASLRDFVSESNRGSQFWFAADLAELERYLTPTT